MESVVDDDKSMICAFCGYIYPASEYRGKIMESALESWVNDGIPPKFIYSLSDFKDSGEYLLLCCLCSYNLPIRSHTNSKSITSNKKVSFTSSSNRDICSPISDINRKVDMDYLKFRKNKVAISMHEFESAYLKSSKIAPSNHLSKKVEEDFLIAQHLRF
jgi:hypothetical protein